jgi:hypothetical protein
MAQTAHESTTQTSDSFSVLFLKMKEAEHLEVTEASKEMAGTEETVRLLSEAISEIEQSAFTTYVSN